MKLPAVTCAGVGRCEEIKFVVRLLMLDVEWVGGYKMLTSKYRCLIRTIVFECLSALPVHYWIR